MMGGQGAATMGASAAGMDRAARPSGIADPNRLDFSLMSRDLVGLIREHAAKHCRTPRMLVIEILEKVFAPGDAALVAAVLDED